MAIYQVTVSQTAHSGGIVMIKASSKEEATKLASESTEVDWSAYKADDIVVDEVEAQECAACGESAASELFKGEPVCDACFAAEQA